MDQWGSRRGPIGSAEAGPIVVAEATTEGGGTGAAPVIHVHVNVYTAPPGADLGTPYPAGAEAAPADEAAEASAADAARPAPAQPPIERWAYAVWRLPGRPDWVGVHAGGSAAWRALEGTFAGRRYAGSGARLRRFSSVAEAVRAFEVEASKHAAGTPARVFHHPCLAETQA